MWLSWLSWRADRQWLPLFLPLVIRRAAFRVFHGYFVPIYYLDIRDYEVINGRLIDEEFIADHDTGNFTMVTACVRVMNWA